MSLIAFLIVIVLYYIHRDAVTEKLGFFCMKTADAVIREVPSLEKHHKAVYMVTAVTVVVITVKWICLILG